MTEGTDLSAVLPQPAVSLQRCPNCGATLHFDRRAPKGYRWVCGICNTGWSLKIDWDNGTADMTPISLIKEKETKNDTAERRI